MLTGQTSLALWRKLCAADSRFYRSRQGRRLVAKALRMVRAKDGKQEARVFRHVIETTMFAAIVGL